MNLKELRKKYEALVAEQKGILDKGDAITAEELSRAEAVDAELETLDTEIKRLENLEDIRKKNADRQAHLDTIERPEITPDASKNTGKVAAPDPAAALVVPGRKNGRVANFHGPDADKKAYRFGQFFLAAVVGRKSAADYCKKNGIPLVRDSKAHLEGDDARGGFLVPEEFENDMIDLREMYGVIRKLAKVTTMRSDTKSVPRRKGGLTAYPVGEGQAIPDSKKGWDRVKLTAKKIGVLALYSSELDEDAIVDIGDDLAGEISYAFTRFEDDCGFNGDGTSAYHSIVGLRNRFKGLSTTRANIGGLVVASGNSWDEITLADLTKVKSRLPVYARKGNVCWVTSQSFYNGVMERLALAAGGVTAAEVAARRDEFFLGYPVEIAQVMPDQEANDDIPCLFGDLSLSTLFGERRQTTIAMSSEYAFEDDELAIRGTERFDINNHDVGTAGSTPATRKAGPVVGLITAAS